MTRSENTHLPPYSSLGVHIVATLNIWMYAETLLCSTDALLRQLTRLVFNQLHWLCAEHFLMHRNQGSVPGSVISAKTNSIMQMQFQLLSEGDE